MAAQELSVQQLIKAAKKSNLPEIEAIFKKASRLDKKKYVNETDENGKTLLHWVAWVGAKDIAEYLIQNGAVSGAKDIHGYTPLFYGAEGGHNEVVFYLIKLRNEAHAQFLKSAEGQKDNRFAREYENAVKNEFNAAFIAAVSRKHMELAQAIFQMVNGIDVNYCLRGTATALHLAVEYKDLDFIEFLIQNGANITESYQSGYGTHSGFNGPRTAIAHAEKAHGKDFADTVREISRKYNPEPSKATLGSAAQQIGQFSDIFHTPKPLPGTSVTRDSNAPAP